MQPDIHAHRHPSGIIDPVGDHEDHAQKQNYFVPDNAIPSTVDLEADTPEQSSDNDTHEEGPLHPIPTKRTERTSTLA